MARPKHPDKDIEDALQYAESYGWLVEKSTGSGHCWGQLLCPVNNKDCWNGIHCRMSVWSTPGKPGNHAKAIKRVVGKCQFMGLGDD